MILKKALFGVAAAAFIGAAAATMVVAAAYALYAVARDHLSPAGASATVAGAAALILLVVGLILALKAGLGRREPSVTEKLLEFARDRPLVAAAAALAASFFAVRNPGTLMAMMAAFMEGKAAKKKR